MPDSLPEETPGPENNATPPAGEAAIRNSPTVPRAQDQATVVMYLKESEHPTPRAIPAKPAAVCSHLMTICSLCIRWWALDWTIDFDATAAGRELRALRRALDAN